MTVDGSLLSWIFLGPVYYCFPALIIFFSLKKRLTFGKVALFCGIYAQIMWIFILFLQNFAEIIHLLEYENREASLFFGFFAALLFGFGANLLYGWPLHKACTRLTAPPPSSSDVWVDSMGRIANPSPPPVPVCNCMKCSALLPQNAKFCTECGEKVQPPISDGMVVCQHCGKKVKQSRFCPECGSQLSAEFILSKKKG